MAGNEIYHYGILGMKWGRRRSREELARNRKNSGTDNWSEDAKTASNIKSKSVKQMSNVELRQLNERTRLEQEYSRLNPSAAKKGRAYIAAAAGVMSTALSIYNNSDKLVAAGKRISNKIIDVAGNRILKDLNKHFNG